MSCRNALFGLLLLLYGVSTHAAPVISSANISGNTITISGSGFGSHADWGGSQAFLNKAWTNFDAGSINSGGLSIGAYPENWSLQTSANRTNSSYYAERRSVNGELGSLSIDQSGTPTEWYASFWFRMPSNTQAGKFMRIWGGSYNIYLSTGCEDTMIRAYCEGCGGATQWDSAVSFGNNAWKHFEFYMSESPATTQVWIDGVLGWSRPDLTHSGWGANGHTWDIGHMVDDSSRGCGTAGAYQYDEVYLDHTRARVELVNASTWASTAIRAPQPPTSWSSSSIVAQLNKGAFANGTYYLYVIDSTGAVSNGYAVTIGGGGGTTYTVTPSAGANGSISPNTPQTISSGATTQFTVTPSGGYTASVGGTCGGSLAGTTYTTNAIVADCTVSATFSGDSTPPVVSNPSPSGTLNYGTSSAAMGVSTNEAATCKYGTSDVAYASLPNTFSTTGGTTHAQSYSVSGGNSYTLYVRCQDGSGNANSSSTTIAFSVSGDEIILDDTDASASQSGSWSPSTYWPNYYGVGYLYAPDATGHWYRWTKTVPAGTYRVYAWWPATAGRPTDVQIDVTHSGGTANVTADQTAHGGMWNLLGQWTFGTTATVQINSSSTGTEGAAADAIRLLLSTSDGTPPVLSSALPSGVQASVVSSVTLQVTTDEAATCKEGPVGSDYAAKTAFSTTGSTSHSLSFSVSAGRVYWLGYQCQDGSANTSSETVVRFAIPAVPKRRLRH